MRIFITISPITNRISRDLVNKHLLQLWYIRHPVQPVGHCLSNVWEGHKLFVLLLLLVVVVEVVLVSFFLLAAPLTIIFLLLILVFIIAFLLEVLKSIQGTLLLLTAEFLSTSLPLNTEFKCLKSRPVSERRLCTNDFIIRYIIDCGLMSHKDSLKIMPFQIFNRYQTKS